METVEGREEAWRREAWTQGGRREARRRREGAGKSEDGEKIGKRVPKISDVLTRQQ